MPNFDGGHYFLTALIPISTDVLLDRGELRVSPIQSLRKSLAILPTALQTPACVEIGLNSPFSRDQRTHFARLVVIEDFMYNGRDPVDAIVTAITKANPVLPQPQDSLPGPFLLFVADFDAASGEASELLSYLAGLWKTMEPELREVFGHCVNFASVVDGASFARYIQNGQIETTMPFNDYWTGAPPLKSQGPQLEWMIIGFGLVGLLAGGWIGYTQEDWWWLAVPAGAVLGLLVGAVAAYAYIMMVGPKPFPTAPGTSLPSILKALYLQQKFTQMAIDVQGLGDDNLQAAFAKFMVDHKPAEATPTQPAGVIKS